MDRQQPPAHAADNKPAKARILLNHAAKTTG
jgi:hypothetical protein